MNRKMVRIVSMLAAFTMLFLVGGCGNNENAVQTSGTKEAVFGTVAYFGASNLNPADSYNGWYMSFFGAGETLFKLDSNYKANPWLVASFKTIDDYTWEFTLKDDVYFQNGEKMTAERVKASLDYMMGFNVRGPETFTFDEISADGQVLTIKTTVPTPALCNDLCDPLSVIQYIDDKIDYETAAVMTGPFIVTEFTPQEKLVAKKFDKYWGGAAKIDKATFLTLSDQDAVTMALQSGEVDMAVMPDATAIALFKDTSKYTVSSAVSTRGRAIMFNMDSDAASDLAVREAIAMSIDRDGFVSGTNGTMVTCYGLYSDIVSYGGSDRLDLKVTKCDLEGAKKILADAGYKDTDNDGVVEKKGKPLQFTMVTSTDTYNVNLCQALQSQLKKVGIDFVIGEYDSTSDVVAAGKFDGLIVSNGMAPTGNFQYYLNTRFVSNASGNSGHYGNAEVDALAAKLESTFDADERDKIAVQITQILMDDMYYCVFANQKFYCIHSNSITGFEAQPSEYYLLDNQLDINKK